MRLIYHSPYELFPLNKQKSVRHGALLKMVFADGLIGYADCHPWPELGDRPLPEQIKLASRHLWDTPNLKKSHFFARLDAEARFVRKNLFADFIIPMSHYSALDLQMFELKKAEKYRRIKFKINGSEISLLKKIFGQLRDCKVRLDFNLTLTMNSFEKFLDEIKEFLHLIDFCEDPFPFHAEQWKAIRQKYSLSLACDRNSEKAIHFPEAADVLVIKPAVQEEPPFLQHSLHQKMVVTSYLDHPLGQLSAAYSAAQFLLRMPHAIEFCGLLSHSVYESNAFSEGFGSRGSRLIPPEGTGFGFDDLLEKLPWKECS